MQTLKIKAAEALKSAGVINNEELSKLQGDLDKLINEKEEFMTSKVNEEKQESSKSSKKTTKETKPRTTKKK